MIPLISFSPEVSGSYSLSEKLSLITNNALVGYLVVFAVLAIIWGILEAFGRIFAEKKKEEKTAEPITVSPVIPETVEEESDEGELVAAIISAISAYTDKPSTSFRVVSFKKSTNNKR